MKVYSKVHLKLLYIDINVAPASQSPLVGGIFKAKERLFAAALDGDLDFVLEKRRVRSRRTVRELNVYVFGFFIILFYFVYNGSRFWENF